MTFPPAVDHNACVFAASLTGVNGFARKSPSASDKNRVRISTANAANTQTDLAFDVAGFC